MVTLIRVVEAGPESSDLVPDVFWKGCLQDIKCSVLLKSVEVNGQKSGRP